MAFVATRHHALAPTASDGSRTITICDSQPHEEGDGSTGDANGEPSVVGTLRLRGAARSGPRVVWSEDVVDNEHMGKKSSKSTHSLSFIHHLFHSARRRLKLERADVVLWCVELCSLLYIP